MLANHDLVRRTARAVTAANVDTYEAAVRFVTDLERIVARTAGDEALALVANGLADLTRDMAAIQLSTIRWILDL
jgi:hypothetical protein